ncbi:MAG: hypothetical protein IPL69_20260 [Saprospiraceae bacterium]|nr:hypothetical protein [Candidatus Brachybacter algidus]
MLTTTMDLWLISMVLKSPVSMLGSQAFVRHGMILHRLRESGDVLVRVLIRFTCPRIHSNQFFRNGTNVLAIEVHNNLATSTDLSGGVWLSFLVDNSQSYLEECQHFFILLRSSFCMQKFKLNRAGESVFL